MSKASTIIRFLCDLENIKRDEPQCLFLCHAKPSNPFHKTKELFLEFEMRDSHRFVSKLFVPTLRELTASLGIVF
jgi:hypothetical protein